jgi:hypothetical protein
MDTKTPIDKICEIAKANMARSLVEFMFDNGVLTFERGPEDEQRFTFPVRMTVGIVAPSDVSTLEQRVAEHQGGLAQEVVDEAIRQIYNLWPAYGHDTVSKDKAAASVNDALRVVMNDPLLAPPKPGRSGPG